MGLFSFFGSSNKDVDNTTDGASTGMHAEHTDKKEIPRAFKNDINATLGFVADDSQLLVKNAAYNTFNTLEQDINKIVADRSILSKLPDSFTKLPACYAAINELQAMPLESNKAQRIRQYRTMSALPECDWCIEEIADDFIHADECGNIIKMTLAPDEEKYNINRREIIQHEFDKFVKLFNLRDNGFNLAKKFVVEGELAWENVINVDIPELGIIGVKYIPCEYYETLVDLNTGNKIGLYIDSKTYHSDIHTALSNSFYNASAIFNNMIGPMNFRFNHDACIPMLWPQVTYISSEDSTSNGLISLPIIEKAKQAYYQYVLMKDAAVILRVTRAPERLLFNVDTGNMNPKMADDFLRRFGNQLRSKKTISAASGVDDVMNTNIRSTYNPTTMLESWIFSKSNANGGTSVETVGSTASYDQIDDLKFFQRGLIKQFKVPWTRFESASDIRDDRSNSISYEEYTFARMILRIQRRFAIGLKNSFITHLKLRGIWENYQMLESDIEFTFTAPMLYDIINTQKLLSAKISTYSMLADREEFSKSSAMKSILGMSDAEINENFKNVAKEQLMMTSTNMITNNIDGTHTFDDIVKKIDNLDITYNKDNDGESSYDIGVNDNTMSNEQSLENNVNDMFQDT